jgi:hypothetical protein
MTATNSPSDYEKARDERTITRTIWAGTLVAVAFAAAVGYVFTLVD